MSYNLITSGFFFVSSSLQSVQKPVILVRMYCSGHAADTESEQRLPKAEVTVAFVTDTPLPGLKADVAEMRESRQVLRLESVFKLFRNAAQVVETEEGIRGLCVELPGAADEDCPRQQLKKVVSQEVFYCHEPKIVPMRQRSTPK